MKLFEVGISRFSMAYVVLVSPKKTMLSGALGAWPDDIFAVGLKEWSFCAVRSVELEVWIKWRSWLLLYVI